MSYSLREIFFLQVITMTISWIILFKKHELPKSIQILVIIAYITVPLAVMVKGAQSAIYISDLIAPLLFIYFLKKPSSLNFIFNQSFIFLFLLLLILPLLAGYFNLILGNGMQGSRMIEGDLIWYYRNITYLLVFGYGISRKLTERQYISFLELNFGMAFVLSIMGAIHYFSSLNFAVFEHLLGNPDFDNTVSVGRGFMGIFRGSVGQWFAVIVLLIGGSYSILSPNYKKLGLMVMILGIGMILLSYSRAGLVGLALGLIFLGVFNKAGIAQKSFAWAGILFLGCWIFFQSEIIGDRITSIFSYSDNASSNRIGAWQKSLIFFLNNPIELLIGVGPTNRAAVFNIVGAYGAHNEYLDVIFRCGIGGLIILCLFIYSFIGNFFKDTSNDTLSSITIRRLIFVIIMVNCAIAITQEHIYHDYASYGMGFYLYLLYGITLGTVCPWKEKLISPQSKNNIKLNPTLT